MLTESVESLQEKLEQYKAQLNQVDFFKKRKKENKIELSMLPSFKKKM